MAVRPVFAAITILAALSLAACNGESEDTTYEVDATDQSGGELIVADEDAEGVDVDLPETEMTNVPPEEMASEDMGEETATPAE